MKSRTYCLNFNPESGEKTCIRTSEDQTTLIRMDEDGPQREQDITGLLTLTDEQQIPPLTAEDAYQAELELYAAFEAQEQLKPVGTLLVKCEKRV